MLEITLPAQEEIAEYFKDKEASPLRIFLNEGGWGGPTFGIALDGAKDTDFILEIAKQTYVVDKELLAKAKPITVDFATNGFKIDTNMELPKNGCDGCSC